MAPRTSFSPYRQISRWSGSTPQADLCGPSVDLARHADGPRRHRGCIVESRRSGPTEPTSQQSSNQQGSPDANAELVAAASPVHGLRPSIVLLPSRSPHAPTGPTRCRCLLPSAAATQRSASRLKRRGKPTTRSDTPTRKPRLSESQQLPQHAHRPRSQIVAGSVRAVLFLCALVLAQCSDNSAVPVVCAAGSRVPAPFAVASVLR